MWGRRGSLQVTASVLVLRTGQLRSPKVTPLRSSRARVCRPSSLHPSSLGGRVELGPLGAHPEQTNESLSVARRLGGAGLRAQQRPGWGVLSPAGRGGEGCERRPL